MDSPVARRSISASSSQSSLDLYEDAKDDLQQEETLELHGEICTPTTPTVFTGNNTMDSPNVGSSDDLVSGKAKKPTTLPGMMEKRLSKALKTIEKQEEELAQYRLAGCTKVPQSTSRMYTTSTPVSDQSRLAEELREKVEQLQRENKRLQQDDSSPKSCDKSIVVTKPHPRLEMRLSLAMVENEGMEKKISSLSIQLRSQSLVLEERLQDNDSLQKRLVELEQEYSKVQRCNDRLEGAIAQAQSEKKRETEERSALLTSKDIELTQAKLECDFNRDEVRRSQEILKVSEEMYNDLEKSRTTEVGDLQMKLKAVSEERDDVQTRLQVVEKEKEHVAGQRNELETKMMDLKNEKSKLSEKTKRLEDAFNDVKLEAEETLSDFKVAGTKLKKIEEERDEYLDQRNVARRTLIDRNKVTEALKQRLEEAKKEIEEIKSVCKLQVEEATKGFQSERQAREKLVKQVSQLELSLRTKHEENLDLKKKLNEQASQRMLLDESIDPSPQSSATGEDYMMVRDQGVLPPNPRRRQCSAMGQDYSSRDQNQPGDDSFGSRPTRMNSAMGEDHINPGQVHIPAGSQYNRLAQQQNIPGHYPIGVTQEAHRNYLPSNPHQQGASNPMGGPQHFTPPRSSGPTGHPMGNLYYHPPPRF